MATRKPKTTQKDKAPAPAAVADTVAPPMSAFELGVGFVLQEKIEGGYVNDPRDPGGETNFGISKRSYPQVDIKGLTPDAAIAIYKRDFWDEMRCDEMPGKIAIAVFDCAVNQGPGAARKLIQKAAGVKADGIVGPMTLGAINEADEEELLIQFASWRLRRYGFTANAATYLRGWAARVLRLQEFLTKLEVA